MSGLFGYFGSTTGVSATTAVERMAVAMQHHRRMLIETVTGSHGAFGRIGLGLINRSAQPLQSADGMVSLWMCGEFYHQERLRAELLHEGIDTAGDDAALALALYMRGGAEGLARPAGAFVAVVWDARRCELVIVNDRFGLYQHFYAHSGGTFVFAPEIKGVLAAPDLPRRLDMVAVGQYMRFQQLLGERTWIEGVQVLPPAAILRYRPEEDRLTIERYWDWDKIRPLPHISFGEAVEESVRLFQRAIDAMTAAPLRVGVYLSGGLDSRTILGFVNAATPLTAITFGAPGCRDVIYATALAQRAGRPQRWFPFHDGRWVLEHVDEHFALTEGLHSWIHLHGISTLEEARQLIDVNLSGWDGGTVMGGRIDSYESDPAYRHAPDEAAFVERLFQGFTRVFTWPGLTDAEAAVLCDRTGLHELSDMARESFAAEVARTRHYAQPYRADYFYLLQHVRRSTQNMIVFQRSAFEVRCPFFDYDLVDFLYGLPETILATPDLHRAIITRRAPALALVPNEKNEQLPHTNRLVTTAYNALQKSKRAINKLFGPVFPQRTRLYADYEQYLRSELRGWAEDLLFDGRLQERGFFDPAIVRQLWDRHMAGTELWTIGAIAPLIAIEMSVRGLIEDEHVGMLLNRSYGV